MAVSNAIKDIEVESVNETSEAKFVKLGSLWQDRTAVIHVLRRFGCRLCRANASELQKIAPILESKGIRVAAVGIEKLGLEEFLQNGYWNGELYIDNGKKIHQALDLKSVGVIQAITMLVANKDVKKAIKKTKEVPGNFRGDGRQLGATFVIAKGGETLMDFRQQNFADHPSNEFILKACGLEPSLYTNKDSETIEQDAKACDEKCSI